MKAAQAATISLLLWSGTSRAQTPSDAAEKVDRLIERARALPPECDPAGQEILICGRRGSDSPYRMPSGHRSEDMPTSEKGWGGRARTLSRMGRDMMPGSNSVVGSGGQSGWAESAVHDWYDDRQEKGLRAPSSDESSAPR